MKSKQSSKPLQQGLSLKQLRDAVEYNINMLSDDSQYIAMDIQHDSVRVVYQLGLDVRIADFVIEADGHLAVNGDSMTAQDYARSRHQEYIASLRIPPGGKPKAKHEPSTRQDRLLEQISNLARDSDGWKLV